MKNCGRRLISVQKMRCVACKFILTFNEFNHHTDRIESITFALDAYLLKLVTMNSLKNLLLLFSFLTVSASTLYSQDWLWSEFQENSNPTLGQNDVFAKDDFVYATGWFYDTLRFNNGTELISQGYLDLYVVKLDLLGNLIWARSYGTSTGEEQGNSIAVDNSGNIFIAGNIHQSPTSTYDVTDSWLLKLNAAGDTIFTKHYLGTNEGSAVMVLNSQDIVYIGSFYTQVNLGGGNIVYGPAGGQYGQSLFITRLTNNATFVWGKMAGGQSYTNIRCDNSIAVDQNDNIYFTGGIGINFGLTVYFDAIPFTQPGDFEAGSNVYFVKYSSAGNAQWVKRLVGMNSASSSDVVVDNLGNPILCGYFNSGLYFDGSTYSSGNSFLHKYDTNGSLIWGKQLLNSHVFNITTDDVGNIYGTAANPYSNNNIIIDGHTINLNPGERNVAVAKFNVSGNCEWLKLTSPNNTTVYGHGIHFNDNKIYLSGTYNGASEIGVFTKTQSSFPTIRGVFFTRLSTCSNIETPSILASNTNLCSGETLYLHADPLPNGSFIWNTGVEADSIAVTAGGEYSLIFMDTAGCTSVWSNSTIINEITPVVPLLEFITPPNGCEGDTIVISTTSPFSSYLWNNGDINDTTIFTQSDEVFVTVVDFNNCSKTSDTMQVVVNDITYGNAIHNVCDTFTWIDGITYNASTNSPTWVVPNAAGCDSIITLSLSVFPSLDLSITDISPTLIANEINADYLWINCATGQPLTGETNQTFIATVNGDYAVIIDNGGCSDTSNCVTVANVNSIELHKDGLLKIFPNPNNGQFIVEIGHDEPSAQLTIYDAAGKLVYQSTLNAGKNNLKLPSIKTGVYMIHVITSSDVKLQKLIIQ